MAAAVISAADGSDKQCLTPKALSQGQTALGLLQFLAHLSMADTNPRFGFVAFAETWNGRLAMLGFVIGLATELLTGQGILGQIGLG